MVGDGILPTNAEHSTVPSIYWRWSGSVSSYHPVTSYYNPGNTATCSVWTCHTLHSLHMYQFSEPAVNTAHLRSHTFFSLPMPQSLPDEENLYSSVDPCLSTSNRCHSPTTVSKGNMTYYTALYIHTWVIDQTTIRSHCQPVLFDHTQLFCQTPAHHIITCHFTHFVTDFLFLGILSLHCYCCHGCMYSWFSFGFFPHGRFFHSMGFSPGLCRASTDLNPLFITVQ